MKILLKVLLYLLVAGVLFGCNENVSSSTSSDNSTTSDNSTASDSCSVNDGFIKYDSSGTAVSDCAASWKLLK